MRVGRTAFKAFTSTPLVSFVGCCSYFAHRYQDDITTDNERVLSFVRMHCEWTPMLASAWPTSPENSGPWNASKVTLKQPAILQRNHKKIKCLRPRQTQRDERLMGHTRRAWGKMFLCAQRYSRLLINTLSSWRLRMIKLQLIKTAWTFEQKIGSLTTARKWVLWEKGEMWYCRKTWIITPPS